MEFRDAKQRGTVGDGQMAIEEPYFTYAMEPNDWGNSASSEIIRIHGGISSHILAELRQSNGIQRCNGSDGLLLQMEGKLKDKFKVELDSRDRLVWVARYS